MSSPKQEQAPEVVATISMPNTESQPGAMKKHMPKPRGHVLSDHSALLKAVNVNKMNHQYIQNLQKANMTLKCKIKEMAEMGPGSQVVNFDAESVIARGDGGRWFDLEPAEEEVELRELGTIEQLSAGRIAAKKERQRRAELSKERRKQPSRQKERSFYERQPMPPVKRPNKQRPRVWVPKDDDDDYYYDEPYYVQPYYYEPAPYIRQPQGYAPDPYYYTWRPLPYPPYEQYPLGQPLPPQPRVSRMRKPPRQKQMARFKKAKPASDSDNEDVKRRPEKGFVTKLVQLELPTKSTAEKKPDAAAIQSLEKKIVDAERTLASEDLKDIGQLIFRHKMSDELVKAKTDKKITDLRKKLDSLIQKAESKLVQA